MTFVWIAVGLFVAFWLFATWLYVRERLQLRRQGRAGAKAALAASGEDAAFDPERLIARARELWHAVHAAHADGDLDRLAAERLVAPGILEHYRSEAAFHAAGADPVRHWCVLGEKEELRTWLLGVVNRDDDAHDRAVVHLKGFGKKVRLPLVDGAAPVGSSAFFEEFYVLGKRDDGEWWVVDRMDAEEGLDNKNAEFILQESDDIRRLTDASLQELASADAIEARIGELSASAHAGDPAAIARDLSLLDGRYDRAVLEAAVRTILRAWENHMIDDGADLALVATPEAAAALIRPGDVLRLPRNVTFRSAAPTAVTADRVAVELEFEARLPPKGVPVETITDDDRRRYRWKAAWTLELATEVGRPWRLVACAPPEQIINILR